MASLIDTYGNPHGLIERGPLSWAEGPTATTKPVMVAPQMSGSSISTPTIWPMSGSSLLSMPHNYYPGVPETRNVPDALRTPEPINPFTGRPVGAVSGSAGVGFNFDPRRASVGTSYVSDFPLTRAPQSVEPGYTREGLGFEAGNAYGPNYRLASGSPALTAAAGVAGASGSGYRFNPATIMFPGIDYASNEAAIRRLNAQLADLPAAAKRDLDPIRKAKPVGGIIGAMMTRELNKQIQNAIGGRPVMTPAPQTITAPGGGGAYVAPKGSYIESVVGSGALVPAALNNPRWTSSTSSDSSNPSWW